MRFITLHLATENGTALLLVQSVVCVHDAFSDHRRAFTRVVFVVGSERNTIDVQETVDEIAKLLSGAGEGGKK